MADPRAVVITGASTGIGRATAEHLDTVGWRVFAGVRSDDAAAHIERAGSDRLTPLRLDVTLVGPVALIKAFLPLLRRAHGRIVNVTSIGGRVATAFFGPYNASKFGLEAIGDSLRQELRPWGIDVIAIEPGSIESRIWESGT